MSVLVIPIDASQIPEQERKQQRLRVAVQSRAGITSEVISIAQGKNEVKLEVDPGAAMTVAIGAESASDEDLFHFQTLTTTVSLRHWLDKKTHVLPTFV